jgi:hypothetical protein
MDDPTTFFLIALPLTFGAALAISAIVMLVTGRAPSYYRHVVRRFDVSAESSFLFWSIVLATIVAAALVLYVGIMQVLAL